jgi:hypothetical protein
MLFALPAIRNIMPGSPPIGCTADVVGFFWNIAIISTAAIMLLSKAIIQYQRPPQENNAETIQVNQIDKH